MQRLLTEIQGNQHLVNIEPARATNDQPHDTASPADVIPRRNATSAVHSSSLLVTALSHDLVHTFQGSDSQTTAEEDALPEDRYSRPESASLYHLLQKQDLDPSFPRFEGESSGSYFIASALKVKYSDERIIPGVEIDGSIDKLKAFSRRRSEYWNVQEWEREALRRPLGPEPGLLYTFPDDDLLTTLVEHYFDDANWIMPLLHRPTFELALAEGTHLRDDGFARVVLLVCAIGSAYVDDTRVLVNPAADHWHTAGRQWFDQVTLSGPAFLTPPSLYELQVCCLASIFLHSSSEPHVHWTLMGHGIRIAQEIGIHRRKVYRGPPNAFDEQWKRAFWVLFVLDRCTAWFLGRTRAIRDEDVDVDLPLEVDDEYWYHSNPAFRFKQPPNIPSQMTGFIQMINITRILGVAVRTLYLPKQSRQTIGLVGQDREEDHVRQLGEVLERWKENLPPHLRWDANQPNMAWFRQATLLYSCYYNGQLTIHRPFLRANKKYGTVDPTVEVGGQAQSSGSASLDISTCAARSYAQMIHIHLSRTGGRCPMHVHAAFQAGVFLLLNLWTSQKIRDMTATEVAVDMEYVRRCTEVLEACEIRWPLAGKYRDLINELTSTGPWRSSSESFPGSAITRSKCGSEQFSPDLAATSSQENAVLTEESTPTPAQALHSNDPLEELLLNWSAGAEFELPACEFLSSVQVAT